MDKKRKEPWELEPAPGGGDDTTQNQQSRTSSGATGGGRGLHFHSSETTVISNMGIHAHTVGIQTQSTTDTGKQIAENSMQTTATSQPTQNDIQPQTVAKSTGNSGGHLSAIKTNYTKGAEAGGKASAASGYGNSHGRAENTTATMRTTATKAAASGSYQNRDSSLSQEQREVKAELELERGERLSNTYNSDGERMTKNEFKAYQNDLKTADIQGMRRIVISPDPALGVTEKEMISITRDTMWAWAEKSSKQFDFSFAVHDGQSVIHSHVLMSSKNPNDINMASKQLETFKSLADEAIQNQLDQKEQLDENLEQALSDNIQQGETKNDESQVNQIDSGANSDDLTATGGEDAAAAEAAEAEELMIAL